METQRLLQPPSGKKAGAAVSWAEQAGSRGAALGRWAGKVRGASPDPGPGHQDHGRAVRDVLGRSRWLSHFQACVLPSVTFAFRPSRARSISARPNDPSGFIFSYLKLL